MRKVKVVVSVGSGMSFMGSLSILFIALKILGFISWSWWLVLIPVWAPLVVVAVIISSIFALCYFQ